MRMSGELQLLINYSAASKTFICFLFISPVVHWTTSPKLLLLINYSVAKPLCFFNFYLPSSALDSQSQTLINYSIAKPLCFFNFYLPSSALDNQSQTLERGDLCTTNQKKGNRNTETTAALWVGLLGHCR